MTKSPLPRPLSVKVIATTYLFSALGLLIVPLIVEQLFDMSHDVLVLGFRISGSMATAYSLVIPALYLFLSIGLWCLLKIARRIAIGFELYGLLNQWMISLSPSSRSYFMDQLSQQLAPGSSVGLGALEIPVFLISNLPSTVLAGIIIWCLIKRKAAFVKPAATPAGGKT
jgi:hypothetical protein